VADRLAWETFLDQFEEFRPRQQADKREREGGGDTEISEKERVERKIDGEREVFKRTVSRDVKGTFQVWFDRSRLKKKPLTVPKKFRRL
jgi:hypothetical protein